MSYSLEPGVVTGEEYLTLLRAAKEGGYAIPAVNACRKEACMSRINGSRVTRDHGSFEGRH